MIGYTNGDSIRFLVTFKDTSGTNYDPSSTWGKVFDSSSSIVRSFSTLTRVNTGEYIADWQSDPGSNGVGTAAFQAYGQSGAMTYTRREILFRLV